MAISVTLFIDKGGGLLHVILNSSASTNTEPPSVPSTLNELNSEIIAGRSIVGESTIEINC